MIIQCLVCGSIMTKDGDYWNCSNCGGIIIRGTGAVIEGKAYFLCSECIKRKFRGGKYG